MGISTKTFFLHFSVDLQDCRTFSFALFRKILRQLRFGSGSLVNRCSLGQPGVARAASFTPPLGVSSCTDRYQLVILPARLTRLQLYFLLRSFTFRSTIRPIAVTVLFPGVSDVRR